MFSSHYPIGKQNTFWYCLLSLVKWSKSRYVSLPLLKTLKSANLDEQTRAKPNAQTWLGEWRLRPVESMFFLGENGAGPTIPLYTADYDTIWEYLKYTVDYYTELYYYTILFHYLNHIYIYRYTVSPWKMVIWEYPFNSINSSRRSGRALGLCGNYLAPRSKFGYSNRESCVVDSWGV